MLRITAPFVALPLGLHGISALQQVPKHLICVQSSINPDGSYDVDKLDVDTLQLDDPFGIVGDVMTSSNLRCATPSQTLSAVASKLDKVTGIAIVDENNVVVGVVSIKVHTMN